MEARDDPGPGERPRHTTQLLREARGLLDRAGLGFADLDLAGVVRACRAAGPATDPSDRAQHST